MAKSPSSRRRKSGGNGTTSAAGRGNDAEALLRQDHRKVEKLFKQFEGAREGRGRQELARQICRELVVHGLLEEQLFYPACREKDVEDDLLNEAQVEHDSVKLLLSEILGGSRDRFYAAKVAVLAEYVNHHVKEEEKRGSGIFAKARKAGVDMVALGERLRDLKQRIEQAEGNDIPPFRPRVLGLQAGMTNGNTQENAMERGSYGRDRDRDDRGRFRDDDDDDRGGRGGRGQGRGWFGDSEGHSRAAEERGRGSSFGRYDEDYDDRGGRGSRSGSIRDRDEQGRFMSDDDDQGGGRGRSRGGFSRYDEDDDRGGRGRSGFSRDRDEQGRFMSDDDDNGGRGRSRSSSRDDDDNGGGRGHGRGGWFGDSEGHSRAARERGRGLSSGRYDEDDDRGGRGGRGQGGWFGDSRGHSEAARRGWRDRD